MQGKRLNSDASILNDSSYINMLKSKKGEKFGSNFIEKQRLHQLNLERNPVSDVLWFGMFCAHFSYSAIIRIMKRNYIKLVIV